MEQQQRTEGQPWQVSPPWNIELEGELVVQPTVQRGQADRGWEKAVVPKLKEGDDIEHHLKTLEAEWAVRLIPYLSGRV